MQRSEALELLDRVAEAIRLELGDSIDVYPAGGPGGEADPINRVFRAVARCLLEAEGGPAPWVSKAFCRLARRRLAGEGWGGRRARLLMRAGPGSPDDWLTFLILSSRAQLEPLLDRRG